VCSDVLRQRFFLAPLFAAMTRVPMRLAKGQAMTDIAGIRDAGAGELGRKQRCPDFTPSLTCE
jgi:hypothetical protein